MRSLLGRFVFIITYACSGSVTLSVDHRSEWVRTLTVMSVSASHSMQRVGRLRAETDSGIHAQSATVPGEDIPTRLRNAPLTAASIGARRAQNGNRLVANNNLHSESRFLCGQMTVDNVCTHDTAGSVDCKEKQKTNKQTTNKHETITNKKYNRARSW